MNIGFLRSNIVPLPMNRERKNIDSCHGAYSVRSVQTIHSPDRVEHDLKSGRMCPRSEGLKFLDAPMAPRVRQSSTSTSSSTKEPTVPNVAAEKRSRCCDQISVDKLSKHEADSAAPSHPYPSLQYQRYSFPPLPPSVSKSIPISSESMRRTASELRLLEEEALADYRDFCMYTRIVNGIHQRRSWTELPSDTDNATIHNIIQTRNRPVHDEPSSYRRECLERHAATTLHPVVFQNKPEPAPCDIKETMLLTTPASQDNLKTILGRVNLPAPVGNHHLPASLGFTSHSDPSDLVSHEDDLLFEMDDL